MRKAPIHSIRLRPLSALVPLMFLAARLAVGCAPGPETACTPICGSGCGQDNGCGGSCGCADGLICDPAGACVDPAACAQDCQAHEACQDGRCVCVPQCDGRTCGDDGCGGTCACPDGTQRNGGGSCVPPPECTDTCAGVGWVCGDICGEQCGDCGAAEMCVSGVCQSAVNCTDCPLRMFLLSKQASAGQLGQVALAIEYAPQADQVRPRMADLRVAADLPVTVVSALAGVGLSAADKQLYTDPGTGLPYRIRADGSIQMLIYSLTSAETLAPGRLITLTVSVEAPGPITFHLQRRDQVLAPPAADALLQAGSYDAPVVVQP